MSKIIETHFENEDHTKIGGTRDNNTAFSGATVNHPEWQEVVDQSVVIVDYLPPPDTSVQDGLDRTDRDMARIGEDLIVHILTNGSLPAKSDFDENVIEKINARRSLRGESSI